jgi:Rad3-related DNA helicase
MAMVDSEILGRIDELVAEEHTLRSRTGSGGLDDDERQRLARLEAELDQCWDLLRQRRARREYGENPDNAESRPIGEVESYLQ